MIEYLFLITGIIGAAFSYLVVIEKRLYRAALWLMLFLLSVSTLYVILGSGFLGAVQIIIYVGAVITLLVFTIMLTRGEEVAD
ncbi:MAG: NADH-quinone oxidoreductase subunit J family protein [Thermoplasmata archaeon]